MAHDPQQLDELRDRIKKIDHEILERLNSRARLSLEVRGLLESEPITLDATEQAWLSELEASSSRELPQPSLRAIFRRIRAEARALEQPARVAYVGPEGGFAHQMARRTFGEGALCIECVTAAEALDEVVRSRAAFAVFPFESSVDGLVQSSVTALAQTELVLVAERAMAASFDIMSRTGNLGDIEKIYATATARSACQRFLQRELAGASVLDVRSPVMAARLAHDDHGGGALVPESCGRAAELQTVRANVGDVSDVRFRYGIASGRPAMRSGHDTTCILFAVDDSPGSLFEILRHFAERGINLKKLQSRPLHSQTWEYVFYVEVTGHVTDRPVVTALEAVKRSTKYLKVLGSFPIET
ncbi:MAG TPA: prephenate dehydratase domain-containing protein [Polyangiaceae bacterium]|jgi:chorismate mutase/prephenate dehydratase